MASVNKVILIGNLGQDPEKRVTGGGQVVTNFNIATTERWNDKSGQKQERTEWHRIVVWGPMAENCAQYLSKGRPVYIEGSLRTRQWDDKEGVKRYTTEVVAQRVQFLGSPPGDRRENSAPAFEGTGSTANNTANNTPFDAGSGPDDVPF
ncbi:MAG: single-stranded DNA-binding protein [bacterium]